MHLSVRYLAVLIFIFAFVGTIATSFIQAVAHSWKLPICWHCGASKVRRSANYSITDGLVKFLFLVPYRCRGCRSRFYGLRNERLLQQPHS